MKELKLGTRGSMLALRQSELVKSALESKGYRVEIVTLVTAGDRKQGTVEASRGDKKDWIAGIEEAVARGEVDFAIHSSKDVPIDILPETDLIPVLKRENPYDAFIPRESIKKGDRHSFFLLPKGAHIGTSSLRRGAQLLRLRPDLKIVPVRGNVTTRLEKLRSDPELAAIVLAGAGIDRLGLEIAGLEHFTADQLMPAVNQGVLVAQYAKARLDIREVLLKCLDQDTYIAWCGEREVIRALGADCSSAVSVFGFVAIHNGERQFHLASRVLSVDGSRCISESISTKPTEASRCGEDLGKRMLSLGALELLSEARELRKVS